MLSFNKSLLSLTQYNNSPGICEELTAFFQITMTVIMAQYVHDTCSPYSSSHCRKALRFAQLHFLPLSVKMLVTCLWRLSSSTSRVCRKRCLSVSSLWAPLRASLLSFTSFCTVSSWAGHEKPHWTWLRSFEWNSGVCQVKLVLHRPSCGTTAPPAPCSS